MKHDRLDEIKAWIDINIKHDSKPHKDFHWLITEVEIGRRRYQTALDESNNWNQMFTDSQNEVDRLRNILDDVAKTQGISLDWSAKENNDG